MKPTASPPYFPYPHRTMAQVMADEAAWEGFMERLLALGYTEESEFIIKLREAVDRDGVPDMQRLRAEAHKAMVART